MGFLFRRARDRHKESKIMAGKYFRPRLFLDRQKSFEWELETSTPRDLSGGAP
jgi:hypothetical protein